MTDTKQTPDREAAIETAEKKSFQIFAKKHNVLRSRHIGDAHDAGFHAGADYQAKQDANMSPIYMQWEAPSAANNWCHIARTPIGNYYVHVDGGLHHAMFDFGGFDMISDEDMLGEPSGSLSQEQGKCQDHFNALARSLFTTAPKQDAAEIERLTELLRGCVSRMASVWVTPMNDCAYKQAHDFLKESDNG